MHRDVRLDVVFFRTGAGREPVREWLRSLPKDLRRVIGADIKTVQIGWPMGMPLVRKLESGLWETRSDWTTTSARVLVTVRGDQMVLLHGFTEKSRRTPRDDLALARTRKKALE